MNGVHDLGGMHGMGPVAPEPNEPVFHHAWEARMLALNIAAGAWRKWNIDAGRHARERIPPADYLRLGYYEKWLAGLLTLLAESGLVGAGEIASGRPAPGSAKAAPPLTADRVAPAGRASARCRHPRASRSASACARSRSTPLATLACRAMRAAAPA
jgi:hypothetical protein